MSFVNLHRHSMFSTGDAIGTPEAAAEYAKKLGQSALCLTDHGVMSGLVDHYHACLKEGIKPILGCEGYFQPEFKKDQYVRDYIDPQENKDTGKVINRKRKLYLEYYHISLIAENTTGYHNLSRLMTEAGRSQYYKRPIIDWDMLERYHEAGSLEGIICLSGCISGYIPREWCKGNKELALDAAKHFIKLFGDRFYFEVMPHRVDIHTKTDLGLETQRPLTVSQKEANRGVIKLAKHVKRPVVMTVDSHYIEETDYPAHIFVQEIRKDDIADINDYSRLFMPNEEEVLNDWRDLMGTDGAAYVEETQRIADRCSVTLEFGDMVPKFDEPDASFARLEDLARKGLAEKRVYGQEYDDRLRTELDVIRAKQFQDYFLLCQDIVQTARDEGVDVGYGRGSVCGSLLAYAIGLTNVDPIRLGTIFERFLRPDKKSLPDIDMDFDSNKRSLVIEKILHNYEGRAAPIATYGYYKVRNMVNDIVRVFAKHNNEAAKVDVKTLQADLEAVTKETASALTDRPHPISLQQLLKDKDLLRAERAFKLRGHGMMWYFSKLYAQVRFIGRHAAGIAITADDISNYVPLSKVRGDMQTAYDLNALSRLNILKMDILGLATLSVIGEAERRAGTRFEYSFLDDPDVYADFCDAKTDGIFQFESRGAKGVLQAVKPSNFGELVACTALNRPAPIQLGLLDAYVAGKSGKAKTGAPYYQYTAETYGAIIYQEQVMRICREFAGMDWPEVDKVMKGLRQAGKRAADPLEERFVEGTKGKLKEPAARDLYHKMTLYLFNKGHGVGYTLLSFYAMWLKHYHPREYYFALIKHETDDQKIRRYEQLATRDGILVFQSHVNLSEPGYKLRQYKTERVILRGLSSVPGVGPVAAQQIYEERKRNGKYKDEEDLIARVPKRALNSRVLSALRDAGALTFNTTKYEEACSAELTNIRWANPWQKRPS